MRSCARTRAHARAYWGGVGGVGGAQGQDSTCGKGRAVIRDDSDARPPCGRGVRRGGRSPPAECARRAGRLVLGEDR